MEVNISVKFPKNIDKFLKICALENIAVIYYGGAITNFLLDKTSGDLEKRSGKPILEM